MKPITPQELRIGNYVYCITTENIETISGIVYDEEFGQYSVDVTNGFNELIMTIQPVELTEEILLRLGFTNSINYPISKVKGPFRCNYGNRATWTYKNKPIKCDYLHELQNLYFALCGKELELKPKK